MARTKRAVAHLRRHYRVEIRRAKRELALCERLAKDAQFFNVSQQGAVIRAYTIDLVLASAIISKGMPEYVKHVQKHLKSMQRRYRYFSK